MQQRFIELTSALVEEIGIQCDIVPGENIVTVPIGDGSVNLCLLENLGAVVFQGSVAVIAASDKNAVCTELLRMNSLLQASRGAAFGLEGDVVTLQSSILLEGVTQEAFNAHAALFLDALARAVDGFDAALERARSSAPAPETQVPMPDMLRI